MMVVQRFYGVSDPLMWMRVGLQDVRVLSASDPLLNKHSGTSRHSAVQAN